MKSVQFGGRTQQRKSFQIQSYYVLASYMLLSMQLKLLFSNVKLHKNI